MNFPETNLIEWDDEITLPGIPQVDFDLADVAPPDGQDCYFCGQPYPATGRTTEGHAICSACKKWGVPGR